MPALAWQLLAGMKLIEATLAMAAVLALGLLGGCESLPGDGGEQGAVGGAAAGAAAGALIGGEDNRATGALIGAGVGGAGGYVGGEMLDEDVGEGLIEAGEID